MNLKRHGFGILVGVVLAFGFFTGSTIALASTTTLIPQGAVWKYLDNGTDQGVAWKEQGFDDTTWSSGAAQLGYGDGDEQTIVSYGDPNNKHITTYFRHTFHVADASAIVSLDLEILRDDGAVVYLNGTQIATYSMPSTFDYRTYATTAAEYAWEPALSIPANLLVAGANVLAIEVHQCNGTSSDLSLDAVLTAEVLLPGTAPAVPVLIAPANGAGGVSIPPTLQAQVSDPDNDSLTVTFYGRKNVAADPFTLVVLPDTQKYVATSAYAPIFTQQTQWIVENRATLNIVAVTHEGDIVDTYNSVEQWDRADASLSVLENSGIPFGLSPGNHDQPTTLYNQYFPPTRFSSKPWYGGNYPADKNDNNYVLFTAGGMDFILVQLEFWPSSAAIAWADTVLKAFPNRKAIITTHGFLNLDGTRNVHVMGSTEYIWTELVLRNPNVWFVLCGHVHGETRRTDMANGHPVHQLLADYQGDVNGGNGWLRTMQFVPAENKVFVRTYSPYLNQFQTDADSEFALDFPMNGFEPLVVQAGVPSGTTVSHVWPEAVINSDYQWMAIASDPTGRSAQSPVWTFSTAVADTTPPVISQVAASEVFDTSAVITWMTDEPATSQVEYRASGGTLFSSASDPGLRTSHSILLTGLQPSTSYEFAVGSADAAGNEAASGALSFTTRPANSAPVASDQTVVVAEDTSAAITLVATDANEDLLAFRIAAVPLHGTLSGTAPNLVYTPAANYSGPDAFQFIANDGVLDSPAATITIEISPVADGPIARADSASTMQGVAVTIPVLANDEDPDGHALSIVSVTQGAAGAVSIEAGQLVYRPAAAFIGLDTFNYTVSDGQESATATVQVTVDPNILFVDNFESGSLATGGWGVSGPVGVDGTAAYDGAFGAVLKKASSITKHLAGVGPGTVELSYARSGFGLDAGELGVVEVSLNGQAWTLVETVSNESWAVKALEISLAGPDLHLRFRVNGNDGNDAFRVDEVAITGGAANDAPMAVSDSYDTTEDQALNVGSMSGVLANDRDGENDLLTAALLSGPSHGTLALNPNGSFTYTPDENFNGADSFSYQASDGAKSSEPVTVTISVVAADDAPLANADSGTTAEGASLTLNVVANDTDVDGDALSVVAITQPAHGSAVMNANNTVTYTPLAGYSGADSFTYTIQDRDGGLTSTTSVAISVEPQASLKMHVNSILVSSQDAGKGLKRGYAEVVLVDASGTSVPGATVSGTFSGDINQTLSAVTGTDGKAVFRTTVTVSGRAPRVRLDVTNATREGWIYDAAANVETWDKNY